MEKKGAVCVGGKETKNLNNGDELEGDKTVAATKIEVETEINEIEEAIKSGRIKLIRMVERYCKKCGRKTMHSAGKFKGERIFQCIVGSCGRTICVKQ